MHSSCIAVVVKERGVTRLEHRVLDLEVERARQRISACSVSVIHRLIVERAQRDTVRDDGSFFSQSSSPLQPSKEAARLFRHGLEGSRTRPGKRTNRRVRYDPPLAMPHRSECLPFELLTTMWRLVPQEAVAWSSLHSTTQFGVTF